MSTALPSCDRSMAHTVAPRGVRAAEHPGAILATTVLASSLAFVDGSVVNVGLPAIGRSFHDPAISLTWIVSGYLLPLSALLLMGGAAGDRFGHRKLLLGGVGGFLLASLVCAFAPTLAWLLAGRVLQGTAAAMLMPTSLAILGATFDGEARGKAIGTWAAAGAAAGAVGPLVGGWLIDAVGWRSIFFLNLPIAAGALFLGARYVEDRASPDAKPMDWPGTVLATLGLASLTWGLTLGSEGAGASALAVAGVVAGAVVLGLFVAVERRRGAAAMMPLQLFGSKTFVGLSLLTFLLYGALGGLLVLLPYVLIELEHYTATQAGAALAPMPLVLALASPTMGRLAARIGPRVPLSVGPVLVAIGFLLTTRVPASGSYWRATLPAILVISLGLAGAVAPLTTAVLSSVPPDRTGVASGLNSALARTGGLIATALASAALVAHAGLLADLFRWAMVAGAAAAVAAGVCAFLGLNNGDDAPASATEGRPR